MERQNLLGADYLDIIFDGRNKLYGGYQLRRRYAARARKATAIVLLGASLAAMIPGIAAALSPERTPVIRPVEVVMELRELPPAELPKELPVSLPEPPARMATIDNPVLKIVDDIEVTEPPKTLDELKGKVVGLTLQPGLPGDHTLEPGLSDGRGVLVEAPKKAEPKVHIIVEQMPAFIGDLAQYLGKNLRYPEEALNAGTEGKVGIRFVVNEDGSISEVEVMRQASAALDAEALRVVRAMPRWKPGKQGGIPVKVYFTLPITFRLD